MVEKTFQFLILLIEKYFYPLKILMIFLLIRKLRIAGLRLCGRWFLFLR